MEMILDYMESWLRPDSGGFDLSPLQMMLRAALIYGVAIVLVRLGNKRFMGRNTAFDLILGIILGSVLSRAITGQSPLYPTIAAGATLMAMHWVMAAIATRVDWFGPLIKGCPRLLIKDGEIQKDALRKCNIGDEDLQEALRQKGSIRKPDEVQVAYLERSGDISLVMKDKNTRILDVHVEDGVQTVRIHIGS